MKTLLFGLLIIILYTPLALAQNPAAEQEIIKLSKDKWQWMADKNVDILGDLFHEKAVFVHMGGSWGTERELSIIEGGGIWYKQADVHEVSVNIIDNTAILLNRIDLLAEVGGNEVSNPFEVTEVYVKQQGDWKLTALSFTRLLVREEKAEEPVRQSDPVFPKGDLLDSPNFTGTVWLHMMGAGDSTLHARFGHVTFEPGARTNWHSHPGGQILFITEGQGYYQAKGQPAVVLRKGDVVEIPPDAVHWHGAGPDAEFAHIAISLNTDEGGAVWSGPVTEEEYSVLDK